MKRKEYSIHCLAHLSSSICLFGWRINEMTGIKTIIVWCVWIKCGKWLWHLHIKSHMSQKKNRSNSLRFWLLVLFLPFQSSLSFALFSFFFLVNVNPFLVLRIYCLILMTVDDLRYTIVQALQLWGCNKSHVLATHMKSRQWLQVW